MKCYATIGKRQYHLQDEMIRWCKENIGPGGWRQLLNDEDEPDRWAVECTFGETDFYFRDEKDAVAFLLRWPTN